MYLFERSEISTPKIKYIIDFKVLTKSNLKILQCRYFYFHFYFSADDSQACKGE